jgi:hypothetical protein
MSFKIFSTAEMPQKSFGIFGGGGRSGSEIEGSHGRSGSGGSVGIFGSVGIAGSCNPALGIDGRRSDGGRGRISGLVEKLNSGSVISIDARIIWRSSQISGHFGNRIIGI